MPKMESCDLDYFIDFVHERKKILSLKLKSI